MNPIPASKQRCLDRYQLCPQTRAQPVVLSQPEWLRAREPLERTLSIASEELDQLYALVRPNAYAMLLAEPGGVIVKRWCRDSDAERFSSYGTCAGGLWSEAVAGTNGIGTCIHEGRPISVHRDQHFQVRHAQLSCSSAPIHNVHGELRAVLTLASCASGIADGAPALALTVSTHWARLIEEREFRDRHRASWTLALRSGADADGPTALLALDAGQAIIAADRCARALLGLDAARLAAGIGIGELFADLPARLRSDGADLRLQLRQRADGQRWIGIATPPAVSGRGQPILLTRPRLIPADAPPADETPVPEAGGLAPRALRVVLAHVEAHLDTAIKVEALARLAGLSPKHFSCAFRQSLGLSPHRYVVRQRIHRAAQLLADHALPTVQIANAVGFADQSHLTRCFVRVMGCTPSSYRRNLGAANRTQ